MNNTDKTWPTWGHILALWFIAIPILIVFLSWDSQRDCEVVNNHDQSVTATWDGGQCNIEITPAPVVIKVVSND